MANTPALERFNNAYLPGMSPAERRHPNMSPLHEDPTRSSSIHGKTATLDPIPMWNGRCIAG